MKTFFMTRTVIFGKYLIIIDQRGIMATSVSVYKIPWSINVLRT